jgi:methionyl-tRNA synthetase
MKYYLTTPIYYVNAAPHIGHAYTTIVPTCQALKTMQGYEPSSHHRHRRARRQRGALRRARRQIAAEFTDTVSAEFRASGRCSACRSTISSAPPARSTPAWCNDLVPRCRENGYVYKGSYTGQYCIFDNLYVNDAKPGDPCPDCGRPTETVTEENYFFKLSAFRTTC